MQRIPDVLLQQRSQFFARGDGQRSGRKLFQDLLRVVGAAEERAVQPRADIAMDLGCSRNQQHTKGRADGNRGLRAGGEMPRECLPEPQCQTYRNRKNQENEKPRSTTK